MRIKIFLQIVTLLAGSTYAGYIVFCGESGLAKQHELKQEIAAEESRIASLQKTIQTLKGQIALAQEDSFIIEKIAREELHMSCTNEYVYLLKTEV